MSRSVLQTDSSSTLTLGTVPMSAKFVDPDYYIWCGSLVRDSVGKCHLFYSRWPRALGHYAWVSDSEVAYAVADDPYGPYEHVGVALPRRGVEYWDGMCTHNPIVCQFGGRYYLYYMGCTATAKPVVGQLSWAHRNRQRIGVAVADNPAGPWQRMNEPLVVDEAGQFDIVCCSNPTVIQRPDGPFMMVYKAVLNQQPGPFYGPVFQMVAFADEPTGPFRTHRTPVMGQDGVDFAAEDPCIWWQGGRYRAIVKDMKGYFTDAGKSLVQFESEDGLDWSLTAQPLVGTPRLCWADGSEQVLHSLERPQIHLEDGKPTMLLCAADTTPKRTHSFNVQIPIHV